MQPSGYQEIIDSLNQILTESDFSHLAYDPSTEAYDSIGSFSSPIILVFCSASSCRSKLCLRLSHQNGQKSRKLNSPGTHKACLAVSMAKFSLRYFIRSGILPLLGSTLLGWIDFSLFPCVIATYHVVKSQFVSFPQIALPTNEINKGV